MQIKTWMDKFNDELSLRGRAESTMTNYKSFLEKFLSHFDKEFHHPTHISVDEIKKYLVSVSSPSQFKQSLAALKFFFGVVVKQPEKLKSIHYRKHNSKLPDIIDKNILLKRISDTPDARYKAMFVLLYGTGMRVGELIKLKVADFNKERMTITIRRGKGNKDRIVPYTESIRDVLKLYFVKRKESIWFFHGENPNNYVSKTTVEKKCREYLNAHPHQLRHCFAVNFLESGGSIYVLKELLGHKEIETTEHYLRVTRKLLLAIPNPIDELRKVA